MTEEQIVEKLKKHEMWLNGEEGGVRANFILANMESVDLSYQNLRRANFSGANLRRACLVGSNLSEANFFGSDLSGADLMRCNLKKADFEQANLRKANLPTEERYRLGTILKEPMIAYKKCWNSEYNGTVIVTLEIPIGAVVFCINGSKCRTNRAKVVAISEGNTAISSYSHTFVYEIGNELVIDDFDLMYNSECSSGIHFFKTREEAENY